jgi:hypothetical protein
MSFLLKLLGAWFLISVAVGALIGRLLRAGDRRASALRERAASGSPEERARRAS